jgi:ribonuclease P/MRP protein subunit RPP40
MCEGVPQGSVLAPLLFLFIIDDLQDRLPRSMHSSLFADDSALWVHSPKKDDAVPVFQEGVREVYRWARAKKLTLNLKKCKVSFFSADPHEVKWQPVVEVEGTQLAFNSNPLLLGVELGRTLSGKEPADRKAASLTKGSQMLTALSGSDWGWSSDLLRKVYQTSHLSGATYTGGG